VHDPHSVLGYGREHLLRLFGIVSKLLFGLPVVEGGAASGCCSAKLLLRIFDQPRIPIGAA